MTLRQTVKALRGLSDLYIERTDGYVAEWFVGFKPGVEIGGDGGALMSVGAHGHTRQEAILRLWRNVTSEVPTRKHLVVDAFGNNRREVKWNGFVWQKVNKNAKRPAHG
jgi:hypothetical protein